MDPNGEHIDNKEFRSLLLNQMIDNHEFAREVIPYVKNDYFVNPVERSIWDIYNKYYEQYEKIPSRAILKVGIEKSKKIQNESKIEAKEIINQKDAFEELDLSWMKDKTEEWCKLRACVNAVIESMQILDGNSKQNTIEFMPTILAEAVSVNFDRKIGTDYLESADFRYDLYHNKLECVPTGLDHLDDAMGGGYPVKALIVFMASTGVGKSLTMCHSAASALKIGRDVLYITMEMAEEKIAQRIDCNLLDLTVKEILDMEKTDYVSEFEKMKKSEHGRLIIKEYGTGSASITNFKALIQELKSKQNFEPSIIFIDYLNICASARAGKNSNSYEKVKYIAEELRSLAMEFKVPIISATQANRDGINNSELDLTNTSESIALPATCDAMFALSATEDMRKNGTIKVSKLKNRFGDPMDKNVHMIGVDYSKMRLFDLNNQPAHINAQNQVMKEEKAAPLSSSSVPFETNNKNNDIEWS